MGGIVQAVISRFISKPPESVWIPVLENDFESLTPFFDPQSRNQALPTFPGPGLVRFTAIGNTVSPYLMSGTVWKLKHLPGWVGNGKFGYAFRTMITVPSGSGCWPFVGIGVMDNGGTPTLSAHGCVFGSQEVGFSQFRGCVSQMNAGGAWGTLLDRAPNPNATFKGTFNPAGKSGSVNKFGSLQVQQLTNLAEDVTASNSYASNATALGAYVPILSVNTIANAPVFALTARIERALIRVSP